MSTQTVALQLADAMDNALVYGLRGREAAAELRRLHRVEEAFNEWIEKTAWVQESARTGELGMHRADVLKARIDRLEGELQQLAESVAKRLEQAGAGMQAGLIREVFIDKSHP
ncbi:MAG: hypothetical protein RL758_8 [Pseudomonadota bacterium]|jgi:hypothetical protein